MQGYVKRPSGPKKIIQFIFFLKLQTPYESPVRDLNTEIVSSTLLRPDQAFERPQRPTESLTTPTFMPEVKARGARGGRQSDEVSK